MALLANDVDNTTPLDNELLVSWYLRSILATKDGNNHYPTINLMARTVDEMFKSIYMKMSS